MCVGAGGWAGEEDGSTLCTLYLSSVVIVLGCTVPPLCSIATIVSIVTCYSCLERVYNSMYESV